MRGAEIAPQPCIRLIREDQNHDAVMRIGGEAPGRRAHSPRRHLCHVRLPVPATSDRQSTVRTVRQRECRIVPGGPLSLPAAR